jgi:fructuronate reductase
MQLNAEGIVDQSEWKRKGFEMPRFDRDAMVKATLASPVWIHFGAGNIFRGFPAMLMQHLLDQGGSQKGIIVGEGFDYEIIDKIYAPHDDISLLVTLKADGSIAKTVVGSVAAAYKCDSSFADEWKKFQDAFASPSLQMVSFTITEKGFGLKGRTDSSSRSSSPIWRMARKASLQHG